MSTFDADSYLARLKPFQQSTVEHVFERFFHASDPVDRYLVADEVGLGKTMIARGLVAKMIEHYAATEPDRRIDVLYVCSNQAIAKQNFSKLAIVGNTQSAVTDRITKLPLHIGELETKLPGLGMAVNFIPITPTTSLDLRSNVGRVDERALLWKMLADDRLLGRRYMGKAGPRRLMKQQVTAGRWEWELDAVDRRPMNVELLRHFVEAAKRGSPSLVEEFEESAELFKNVHRWNDEALRSKRTRIVGRLRRALARTCIEALEPDLIILDEFQRFPKLLDPEGEVGELAELLFDQPGAKTLLLSATPYKMLTRRTELDEDHHADFLKTTTFLLSHDAPAVGQVTNALAAYRAGLRSLAHDDADIDAVRDARDTAAEQLGRVMCRTERLGATPDRNGMLDFTPAHALHPKLTESDLMQFRELHQVAHLLRAHDMVEYWKSAPFPLNFMDEYKLAKDFEVAVKARRISSIAHGLDVEGVRANRAIDVGNARLRGLIERLDEEQAWPLLWLPPSLPYYGAGRPFDRASITTKRLVFSAWTVVPKAIAALTSYEAERQLSSKLDSGQRTESQVLPWRADGPMQEVVPTLPSRVLAGIGDPLVLARERGDEAISPSQLLKQVEREVAGALRRLDAPNPKGGREDSAWYAVAGLLLDDAAHPGSAVAVLDAADAVGIDAAAWSHHRRRLQQLVADPSTLGRRPGDLAAILARVAVAGPGICALRALGRGRPDSELEELLAPSLEIGLAFQALFNLPEAYAIVRTLSGTRSTNDVLWKACLDYCVAGNLQAVLDEYVHALHDWVEDRPPERGGKVGAIVETFSDAIGIKTTSLTARTLTDQGLGEPLQMRARFALRLGDGQSEDKGAVTRVDTVRKAFNSPFWPFVLATTSIGQEGLDFHHYSHAVVHWNLPSNPVDLEQREGRVHRFKNHAVRRNLALRYRAEALASADPWRALFETAPAADEGLQPFWVFNGPARIERHALTMPMSRDAERLDELARLLGIYRLAFGQPRQDELLAALERVPGLDGRLHELLIDLRPTSVVAPS